MPLAQFYEQARSQVEQFVDRFHRNLAAPIAADKKLYRRQIEATERQIDALGYALSGLTVDEITLGEGR